jgi:intracellular septation protein
VKALNSTSKLPPGKTQALAFFFGGLLPVIAFTVIEEKWGTIAGLVAGMVFGLGEIIYELIKHKKVSLITWIGNGLLLGLGAISLISEDGIWFKLQPALFEYGFFVFLAGSWLLKKPFLVLMLEKQNPTAPDLKQRMSGMTFRLGLFFLAHGLLATWAAFYWSTESWALLKGVGLTVSMIVYMALEIVVARLQLR